MEITSDLLASPCIHAESGQSAVWCSGFYFVFRRDHRAEHVSTSGLSSHQNSRHAKTHIDVQGQLLQQAAAALQECEALEERLVLAARPAAPTERRPRLPPPLILSRTTTTVDVSPCRTQLPATAVFFAAYCKPFGAGVELSINPTATQYDGTGVLTPVGSRVTIQNLQQNDTYVFAVAVYDAKRQLIGGLGAPPQRCRVGVVCAAVLHLGAARETGVREATAHRHRNSPCCNLCFVLSIL